MTTSRALPPGFESVARAIPGLELTTDPAECWTYGYDNSRRHQRPGAVALPESTEALQQLVALCNHHRLPMVGRGSGTGTAGASVPVEGAVVIGFQRMNRILELDPDNRIARVQPGVLNASLQQAAGQVGLFWPPDPSSAAIATIGGNLALNSAGPAAVKYGTPRENTLGLKAITATGKQIITGVRTTKGVVGYDLTRLLIGSEGTLALITEATLRLLPKPPAKATIRALYRDIESATIAVTRIMAQPTTPCALEFMDDQALELIRRQGVKDLPEAARAMLLIDVDGDATTLPGTVDAITTAAKSVGCLSVDRSQDPESAARLWSARKALSPALREIAPMKINEDVVVPVTRLPELIAGTREIAGKYQIQLANFGHAGNGNIHVNLLVDPSDPAQRRAGEQALEDLIDLVLSLDGTLSGEHGIGLVKRDFVDREIGPESLQLMRGIKQLFDPLNLLNPGKLLPSEP
ncbi:MAG: FAD-binding protein [Gammaproteobacteria bacterium]|nr:FAD-binding protein [Gammaproteobacteria bacterium]